MKYNFKVGDYVYASDWCLGEIVKMNRRGVWVEFDIGRGGGTCRFGYDEIRLADDIDIYV